MRHGCKLRKLNRTSSHRKAMFGNMAVSLIMHEQITTTLPKAKAIRPIVEKLVTLGKAGDLSAKRKLFSIVHNKQVVDKLCEVMKQRYQERNGGYLRIIKNGFRHGDMAPIAVIEFIDRDESAKGKPYFDPNAATEKTDKKEVKAPKVESKSSKPDLDNKPKRAPKNTSAGKTNTNSKTTTILKTAPGK